MNCKLFPCRSYDNILNTCESQSREIFGGLEEIAMVGTSCILGVFNIEEHLNDRDNLVKHNLRHGAQFAGNLLVTKLRITAKKSAKCA